MRDTIYRDDAIEAVMNNARDTVLYSSDNTGVLDILHALPSAEDVILEGYNETDGVIEIEKQSAKDVGEIKSVVIRSPNYTRYFYNKSMPIPAEPQTGELISRAEPTVIRSRTLMPTKDFKAWAERIREVNPNAVVIPCDAEVVSAEALQAVPTHGRLIDADALMEYCSNQKTKTISNNDIARFPTVQADRPHGEWIETTSGTICSNCGKYPYDDGEYHVANWYSDFCPNCGADMRGGGADEQDAE